MKNKKGFVVSAVLYPLLVLFLAIIMGLLSMTDTRKRILDKMKLEITDNIFDDAACSCDTILAKLNYIIANGTGGSGGDTGSYAYNKLTLNVKTYETTGSFPVVGNIIGDIAVLSDTPIKNYYVSTSVPKSPQEGTVWIVQDNTSNYYVTSDWNKIGISYVMQYENSKWVLKKSYVYNGESWTMLYYVPIANGKIDLSNTDINAEITKTYDYTGTFQIFSPVFSGYYKIELWGAQGGNYSSGVVGGLGSYTSGEIYLNAGEKLYIYVGGQGKGITGGFNGGGNVSSSTTAGNGVGGGGATDVRLVPTSEKNVWNEFESLKSRIMVAAGGGGSAYYYGGDANYAYSPGGAGGGFSGYDGQISSLTVNAWKLNYGVGAKQSLAGYTYYNIRIGNGSFGVGASSSQGAGGGGGYYGGGAGAERAGGSGGGGSSYISGHAGCSSIDSTSLANNIIHNGSAYHYSGYYFINTVMIDGKGISKKYNESSNVKQPSFNDNELIVGNSGDGHAKITLVSIEIKDRNDLILSGDEQENLWSYTYSGLTKANGRYQVFDVKKTGTYKIELWGAQGSTYSNSVAGGLGSYTSGNISLTKGTRLYVYVGSYSGGSISGGYNGGGNVSSTSDAGNGVGGGGATDIRVKVTSSLSTWNEFESLKSRIMVAAGGGGAAYYYGGDANYAYSKGGAAGGLNGYGGSVNTSYSSWASNYGTGATQLKAGYCNSNKSSVGGFGYGGASSQGAGGGGGWYGGGGGAERAGGSGGGGASYISGHAGSIGVDSSGNALAATYSKLADSISYTGFSFSDTKMIDGTGYSWSTKKDTYVLMPTQDGSSTMVGNSYDGYAKITYLD